MKPGLGLSYISAFCGELVQSTASLLNTQPYLGNSQSRRAWSKASFSHLVWSLEESSTPPDLTKSFQCLPVPGSELTGLQFSSVAGSSHCHFPSFGDTACIKLAFENVNKGFFSSRSPFFSALISWEALCVLLLAPCRFPKQLTFQ